MDTLISKMQQDMVIGNYSPRTVSTYLSHVKSFQSHLEKSLDQVNEDDIRLYLYHVKTVKQYSRSNLHQAFSAIKYLYRHTLEMPLKLNTLRCSKRGRLLPLVLSTDEIESLFARIDNLKHRLLLMTIYSAGLRLNEGTHLRVTDIDSKRMTIRVRQGKGNKDRYTLLSTTLLAELRRYWRRDKPDPWLFPGRHKAKPISDTSIQKAFRRARIRAGIRKEATVHTLRHSFATHLLEHGVNLFTIKELLGHTSIKTTMIYLHLQDPGKAKIVNPLDHLFGDRR
jgi:site-specific recombinase XerD